MTGYQIAAEAMGHLFKPEEDALKSFSRRDYRPSFDVYYSKLVPAFDAIEELYHTVGDPDQMISNMADAVVGQAVSLIDECKGRNQKDKMTMNVNMQLAVYIFPSILHYKGDSSQKLVDAILEKFKEAFPKSNVTPAAVEFIEKGFQRKFCYITTAVCRSLGREDDCYELNLLREYRDQFLMTYENGEEKVEEYYDIAPSIIKHIDAREDADSIYRSIYDEYIAPCIDMIETGQKDACMEHYIRMVDDLKNRYFLVSMPS